MNSYISILRGINVSGHKKILMSDLKMLYEELGFLSISTYIQSGNVIFRSSGKNSNEQLSDQIGRAIFQKYGFDVPVIVRTENELQQTIRDNPFPGDKKLDPEKMHVTFLADVPGKETLATVSKYAYPPDEFIIAGRDVYLYCPGGYGNTKLSNTFFENKLKVTATTRNWKTVNKLMEMIQSIE